MARIKCKNCGKAYRYETEGCCPECGAYNRPPRHEKVSADGTIYHMNDSDYLKVRHAQADTHSGKVCFEEKECHEEKVCYEKKTRSKKKPAFVAPMLNQTRQQHSNKKGKKSNLAIIVVIAALIGVVTNILESNSGSKYDDANYTEPYIENVSVEDDAVTVWLNNAGTVESGMLTYIDRDGEFCEENPEILQIMDDECVMAFQVDEHYQLIDMLGVDYGEGNYISLDISIDE